MNFIDAIKICFTKYVDFKGRARRSEYWYFVLFNVVLNIITSIIGIQVISGLVSLALLLPGLAVCVRRLHDIGKKWTWILISLIPIAGGIWLLVLCVKDSEAGENQFGPNPKEAK